MYLAGAIALVHVTAGDPFCAGRHSNLVGAAVIANCCADGMAAVEKIIARLLRIVPAGIAHAVVNGIMPVKVMVRVCSVPTPVMRLERVMRPRTPVSAPATTMVSPLNPSVQTSGACVYWIPGSIVAGAPGPRGAKAIARRALLRKIVVNHRIALDTRHSRPSSQLRPRFPSTFHQDSVNDIERLIPYVAVAQPSQDWLLRCLSLLQQGLINEAALFGLGGQTGRTGQIGLIRKYNKKFGLLSVGRVFRHPRRDLVRRSESVRRRTGMTRRSPRLSVSCRTKRKQDNSDRRKTKQNANQDAKFKETALAELAADTLRRRFRFH